MSIESGEDAAEVLEPREQALDFPSPPVSAQRSAVLRPDPLSSPAMGRDHLDAPLLSNRMRRETLDAMWAVVSERRPVLLRYFDAKAKLLGLDRLAWYDLAAPLPAGDAPAAKLPYDDACDTVLRTFDDFSPDLGDFARTALRDRWIEVENRPGKRQGGFCTGFPTAG